MKKSTRILLGVIFVIFVLGFLSFVGIYTISTDKNVYSVREHISVSWFDIKLFRRSCRDPYRPKFYHETINGWEYVTDRAMGWGMVCVNGKIESADMGCDAIVYSFGPLLKKGADIWSSSIIRSKETMEICEYFEEPVPSYELKPAPPGRYKVKFGWAEKVFEIK